MKQPLFDTKTWPFWDSFLKENPQVDLYVVGGAVRDQLLGRRWKDADFVIRGMDLKTLIKKLKAKGEANLVGTRFGVVKFRPQGMDEVFDIALPRRERSLSFSGAYRDFEIQSDPQLPIEEDLSRRDFTINAMAWHVNSQTLLDPFFGQKDLQDKIIRTVGAAVTRFQEDYSRMLRAVRFACQLNFDLSAKVEETVKKMAGHFMDTIDGDWVVAREVISQEFIKALDAAPVRCLRLTDRLGILQVILPEIDALKTCKQSAPYHLEGTAWNHILLAFEATETDAYKTYFPEPISVLAKLGIIFHDVGKPLSSKKDSDGGIRFPDHAKVGAKMTARACKRLRLGATEYAPFRCEDLAWITRYHLFSIHDKKNPAGMAKLEELFFSRRHPSKELLQVMLADLMGSKSEPDIDSTAPFRMLWERLQKMAPNGTLPEPLLTGDEIMSTLGIPPGQQIGSILTDLREKQLTGEIITKDQALDYLHKTKHTDSV